MPVKFSSKRPLSDAEEAEVQRMIASDPDAPEATEEELAWAKPFREIFPDLGKSIDREIARRGRPKVENTKTPVTIRLDPDVVEHYKATGKGWQSRINDDLRKTAGL
ncbi:BrnA antitoxin family protein [Agrobacterium larrymoorei]|uniref:BrnA antitoxin family protein n=1 Tax=Agrobacterium larrymoorei TaxID=160699 RepID=UPI0015746F09|nr:BrnA antitoxin family protein [Agrobacterium larrymoorei]NTJ42839.1 BrnA antitoxin family protein [Agrobacterium larrymoorei]